MCLRASESVILHALVHMHVWVYIAYIQYVYSIQEQMEIRGRVRGSGCKKARDEKRGKRHTQEWMELIKQEKQISMERD